jgi:hypothetical protein
MLRRLYRHAPVGVQIGGSRALRVITICDSGDVERVIRLACSRPGG